MEFKKIAEICSYGMLIVGSLVLGLMGNATEMGLAIGGGAISLAFLNIEKIASLKAAGIELVTKEEKEQLLAVIEKETEPSSIMVEGFGTDEKTNKVILALKNPKYTWRYVNGLAKESGQSEDDVKRSLAWLAENELGRESKGKKGDIWSLTQKGREVFENVKE